MKDQETVQRFIELRSTGVSFARIAEQLGVALKHFQDPCWCQAVNHHVIV